MSRAASFINKLNTYGQDVTIYIKPSTDNSNKCSCWKDGWPDKDCSICNGTGYVASGISFVVKAFIMPRADSPKALDELELGSAASGSAKAYFSPDVDLLDVEKVVWDSTEYKVSNVDRAAIASEIIYRVCTLEVVG